jgi:2-phosphosulfolactate phosphatase
MVDGGRRSALGQSDTDVRFEWGPTGAAQLARDAECLVVVDVLSFTTSVSICVSRGMTVFPHRWNDEDAAAYAAHHDAELAVRRRDVSSDHPWSLSPAVLSTAPVTPRLVLPSPNGSTIAAAAAGAGAVVIAACLRNAAAVGGWLLAHGYGIPGHPVLIVASGEQWPDRSLRPALEDALGAGAVLAHLRAGGRTLSAEARATAAMFESTDDVEAALRSCGSARRLVEAGYGDDVDAAAPLDCDRAVPVLRDGAFCAQPDRPGRS